MTDDARVRRPGPAPGGLHVPDFNQRAVAVYRSCGSVEEGREGEVCPVAGRWHDDIVMGVLGHEFLGATEPGHT